MASKIARLGRVAGVVCGLLLLVSARSRAAIIPVTPVGAFPADLVNLQSAVNSAAPGDVIQLGAGTFNLTGLTKVAGQNGGIFVGTPELTLQGTSGTILNGPGLFNNGVNDGALPRAILVGADGLTVQSITFQGFGFAILANAGVTDVAVLGCHFLNNQVGVQAVNGGNDGWQIVGNTVTTPSLAETVTVCTPDPTTCPGGSIGGGTQGFRLADAADFTITDNTLQGPGIFAANVDTIGDWSEGITVHDTDTSLRSLRGLVARNTVARFDVGLQSSSLDSIIENNRAEFCIDGIAVGRSTMVTSGVHIADNITMNNASFGILMLGVRQTLVLYNDVRRNKEASIAVGAAFLAVPSISSRDNRFIDNRGGNVERVIGNPQDPSAPLRVR